MSVHQVEAAWHSFLGSFCKVGVICYQGEPNWLGWTVVIVGGILAVTTVLSLFLGLIARWNLH